MAVDIGGALTRKLGPLPAWSYVVIAGGAAWGVYLWKQRTGGGSDNGPSVADELGIGSGSDDLSGHLDDTGLDNVSGVGAGNGGESTVGSGAPKSNEQWVALCVDFMQSAYGYDRDEVVTALYAYLSGKTLSVSQWAIINLAKAKYGAPPDGVAVPSGSGTSTGGGVIPHPNPGPTKPDPTKDSPKKKPGKGSEVEVEVTKFPGQLSTLWGIATKYLGNGNRWKEIWSNPKNSAVVAKRVRPESIRPHDKFWVTL